MRPYFGGRARWRHPEDSSDTWVNCSRLFVRGVKGLGNMIVEGPPYILDQNFIEGPLIPNGVFEEEVL
jgi:hypothetical protein